MELRSYILWVPITVFSWYTVTEISKVLRPSASALMMETVRSSETFATTDQTVRYCVLEDDDSTTSSVWFSKGMNFLLNPYRCCIRLHI
jgi:hypothetical protein